MEKVGLNPNVFTISAQLFDSHSVINPVVSYKDNKEMILVGLEIYIYMYFLFADDVGVMSQFLKFLFFGFLALNFQTHKPYVAFYLNYVFMI